MPECDDPDATLIWLEQEYRRLVHYAENAPGGLSDEDQDASTDRQNEIQQAVARTLAATPAGVGVKMRLLHNEFESLKAPWAEEGWETCLTSLEGMNGTTAVAAEPETKIRTAPASPEAAVDDDAALLALWGAAKTLFDEGARLDHLSGEAGSHEEFLRLSKGTSAVMGGASDVQDLVSDIEAKTPQGIAIQHAILAQWDEAGTREDGKDKLLAARLAVHGTSGGALEPEAASPDAVLFALEAEMKAAHEGLDAAPDNNAAHEPWFQRMEAAEKAALATPAQTAAGVLAKLRMSEHLL